MKVLLVNPPVNQEVYSNYYESAAILPPVGLLYIASYIRKHHEIELIDCPAKKIGEGKLITLITKAEPDVVAITAATAVFPSIKKIFSRIKKQNKKIITILGGSHISSVPVSAMKKCLDLDIGVIGEGELTMFDLLDTLKKDKTLSKVRGIIYRHNGTIIQTPTRKPVSKLDSLPLPAFDLINPKNYRFHALQTYGKPFLLISSRGCPYKCKICDQAVFGEWRAHSPENIIDMVITAKKLGRNFIFFQDDNFGVDNQRVIEFSEHMQRHNMGWSASMHLNDINEKMIKSMKKSNCYCIYVGIESGSQNILKKMNKQINILDIKNKIRMVKKQGIRVFGSFIIGSPSETLKDVNKSIALAKQLPLCGASFHMYVPYPFIDKNSNNEWQRFSTHNENPLVVNENYNPETLKETQKQAYKSFYLHHKTITNNITKLSDINFYRNVLSYLSKNL